MGISQLVQSKGYKKFMGILYGWGASVVIIGALFKINHYPGANLMLILGMGTEAIIFFFSAFEPLHEEVNWGKVYPQLREDGEATPDGVAMGGGSFGQSTVSANPLSAKMDEMFEHANITPELFSKLSDGLGKLAQTTTEINTVTSVVNANNQYASELQKMTEHLSKLNELYLTQMQASSKQMEETRKVQDNMTQIMESLSGSLDDAKKYKTEIGELSQKVAALSSMYGKMLSALSSVK